jgi:NADPH:quinone reductase-like Zn-dependent oxidoreductase
MTIPTRMRGVLLKGHGGFEQLEYREDIRVPVPGAGEVLIRVAAAGVNNTDINTRIGWYSKSMTAGTGTAGGSADHARAKAEDSGWTGAALKFPRIQGADVCGRIVAAGAGVDAQRIGERILIEPVLRAASREGSHQTPYFGSECDGGFAEFTKVPAVHAHRIECALSDAELASFPCAYSAAENMLTRAALAEGETVLITGASGGVGSAAVQLARRRGAHVIAVAAGAKAAAIKSLGGDRVVGRDADLIMEVGQESVDVAIDVVGGPQCPQLLEILKRGGRYAVAGAIAGPVVALDLRTLYLKDLRLLGCTIFDPEVFGNLVRYIESGEIKPAVWKTFPLREIVQAQREFLGKAFTGKIVLIP